VTRAEKARRIARILDRLHPEAAIPLDHVDPYTLLVAVVLSAQCTDERVNQVTPALFARASTPAAMAVLPPAEIERMIRSCGLAPAKAKAIHGLSEILRDQYGGSVPADMDALEALPGVGHKTASVVMGAGVRRARVPGRHAHPPARGPLGPLARRERRDGRARPEGAVPREGLGEGAPPDHPVRPHLVPRARPRPARVSDLLVGGLQGADRARDGPPTSASLVAFGFASGSIRDSQCGRPDREAAYMKPWSCGSIALAARGDRLRDSASTSARQRTRSSSASVCVLLSQICFFVKSAKRFATSSITNASSETIMQVAVPSVKFGLNVKPSSVKNSTDRGRSRTARLTKSLREIGVAIGCLLDSG
jgi:endonuclease-3